MDQLLTYVPLSAGVSKRDEDSVAHREEDDAGLFARFRDGDDNAFDRFFERHNRRLFLYCARLLGDSDQAHDIMGEMWERVVDRRRSGVAVEKPLGYCLTIARNLCLNHIKRRKRQVPFDEQVRSELENDDLSRDGDRSELEEVVLDELSRLPMKYREVLVLNVYSGYDFEEIADMLGISVTAAWKRASRARERLRKAVLRSLGTGE